MQSRVQERERVASSEPHGYSRRLYENREQAIEIRGKVFYSRSLFPTPSLLEPNRSMSSAALHRLRGELLGEIETVARKIIGRPMQPLLQHTAGIECPTDGLGVALDRLFLLQLEVGCQPSQPVHLIAHLVGRSFSRAAKSRVESAHPFEQRSKFGIESNPHRSNLALPFDGHGPRGEQLRQRIGSLVKNAIECEPVFAQQRANLRFDQCG